MLHICGFERKRTVEDSSLLIATVKQHQNQLSKHPDLEFGLSVIAIISKISRKTRMSLIFSFRFTVKELRE